MSCSKCWSTTVKKLTAEISLGFPGIKNLDKPTVFVFPIVTVCLNCGHAVFSVPERELTVIKERLSSLSPSDGGTS
jgi:hypothetical protein